MSIAWTDILNPVKERLRPPERLSVSEWADRHRRLSAEQSAEPGLWRTERTPYLAEIMDAFGDPTVRSIILVKCSRAGGSEAMKNMLLYSLDRAPGPILYVLPVEADARDEARGPIRESILQCPATRGYVASRNFVVGNNIYLTAPRRIRMAWAKAPRTMIRITARYVFFDEVDNCEQAAGILGNSFALAEERIATYGYRGKIIGVSTPSTAEGSAWREWLQSDQRRYHVPCPFCGRYQVLVFPRLTWPKDRSPAEIQRHELAAYPCEACDTPIREEQRLWMVARGVWVPQALRISEPLPLKDAEAVARAATGGRGRWRPRLEGDAPLTKRAGFHLAAFSSPFRSFGQIAAKFLWTKHDPDELRVFVNAWLGEPWVHARESVMEEDLRPKMQGGLPRGLCPAEALAAGVGADVQADCCYYEIRAWGPMRRSWLVAEGTTATLEELYAVASANLERVDGVPLRPAFLAVDSGHRTDEVYEFARARPGVYPVKGLARAVSPVRPSRIEYTARGGVRPASITLYLVDTSYFKDSLHRLMRVPPGEPGAWMLHAETCDAYLRHLTSEHKVWLTARKHGRTERREVWTPRTAAAENHWLDAAVYGLAIADLLGLTRLAAEESPPRPAEVKPYGRRPMGWKMSTMRSGT